MATTNINWGSVTAFAGTVRVYTRQHWADAWALVDNLWPTQIDWNLLPDTPIASFRSDYGPIVPTGDDAWTTVAKVNVLGYYVRVEVDCADGTLLWVGFIDDVVDYQGGVINNGVSDVPYGRLEITAYAMSQCLTYQTMLSSYWWDGTDKRESGSAIPFNMDGRPNRTATVPSGQASHLFSAEADAEYWSSKDIAEYLIAQHAPKNAAGSTAIPFELLNASLLPDWDAPEILPDRMNVWEILEQIIDRRYFLAASVGYSLVGNKNQITIHSLSPTVVDLGLGATLAASSNLLTVSCVTDPATTAIVRSTATSIFHKVRARGAKRTSTATIGVDPGTGGLEPDWDEEDVTAFNAAASGESGYGSKTLEEQRAMNATARQTGKSADVFSRLKIPSDFDWTASDFNIFEKDDASKHYAFPGLIGIAPELPFLTGVDYSEDKIEAETLDNSKAGSPREPLVISEYPWDGSGLFPLSKRIDLAKRFGIYIEGQSLRIQSQDDAVLAGGTEYVALPADPIPDENYDLETVEATLCFIDDRFAEGVDTSAAAATADQVREIAIDVGETFKRDWVLEDTITNLDPALAPKRVTAAAFLNDDKDLLDSYAKMLGLWYLVPRNLLTIQSARPSSKAFVGQLCTTLNAGTAQATTINTVVTSISLSLPIGTDRPGVPQYTLQTAATSFDPSIL